MVLYILTFEGVTYLPLYTSETGIKPSKMLDYSL